MAAAQALPAGKATVRFEFSYDGGGVGKGTLIVNGKPVATGRIERTQCCAFSADEGADVGRDAGTPGTDDYPERDNVFWRWSFTHRYKLPRHTPRHTRG